MSAAAAAPAAAAAGPAASAGAGMMDMTAMPSNMSATASMHMGPASVAAAEVLTPAEILRRAEETLKRAEVRREVLEKQHLGSFGRQILSTRRSSPAPAFGFRATQERNSSGRTTWEEVNIWAELDEQAHYPGPTTYSADDGYRIQGAVVGSTTVRFDHDPGEGPLSPKSDTPGNDAVLRSRPDDIVALLKPRRPAYGFAVSGLGSRMPPARGTPRAAPLVAAAAVATSSSSDGGGEAPVPAPPPCAGMKTHSRLQTFRELREQMGTVPMSVLAGTPRRREPELVRPHYR